MGVSLVCMGYRCILFSTGMDISRFYAAIEFGGLFSAGPALLVDVA